ncbi:MAG: hypothetical protein Q7R99_04325 [bacterium]|nr:hypothetical protein [bacterium]
MKTDKIIIILLIIFAVLFSIPVLLWIFDVDAIRTFGLVHLLH